MLRAGMGQAVLWGIRWSPNITKLLMVDFYGKTQIRDPRYGRLPVWLKAEIAYISGISKDIFKIPQDKKESKLEQK